MTQSRRAIPWSILCIVLAVTGCAQISKKAGVENRWRDQNIVLQEGVTTQQQVLAQLGGRSQIIALSARTVFITYFEETKGRLLFLILYNQANTDITYDRAIFFLIKMAFLKHMLSAKRG